MSMYENPKRCMHCGEEMPMDRDKCPSCFKRQKHSWMYKQPAPRKPGSFFLSMADLGCGCLMIPIMILVALVAFGILGSILFPSH